MTYQPAPIQTEGNKKETKVSDDNVQELLSSILKELKKMNLHLQLMTDTHIRNEEIE